MKNGGGFELLRCTAGSKDLEIIQYPTSHSPRLLRSRIGSSKLFIRPIQLDLDMSPAPLDYAGNVNHYVATHSYAYICGMHAV